MTAADLSGASVARAHAADTYQFILHPDAMMVRPAQPPVVELHDRPTSKRVESRSNSFDEGARDEASRPPAVAAGGDGGGEEGSGFKELIKLHLLMRGRYMVAGVLAACLGAGGGYAGFKLGKKTYRSTGIIKVEQTEKTVIDLVETKQQPPNFDRFVAAQAAVLKQQSTIQLAMDQVPWRELNRSKSGDAIIEFAENLEVTPNGDLIFIAVTDPNPVAAVRAVNSLIMAHERISKSGGERSDTERMDILQAEEARATSEKSEAAKRIQALTELYKSADIAILCKLERDELSKIDVQIGELERAMALVAQPNAGGGAAGELTADQIERVDAAMARLMGEKRVLERKLRLVMEQGGLDQNPPVRLARSELKLIEEDIGEYAKRYNDARAKGLLLKENREVGGDASLAEQLKNLQGVKEKRTARLDELLRKRFEMDEQQDRLENAKYKLDQVRKRIESLRVEDKLRGRYDYMSRGDTPLKHHKDTRIAFAGVGGFGGLMTGLGLVVGFALLDRRLRSAADARMNLSGVRMLGILPRLPEDMGDPEHAALAAHCVHEIRTLLQIWGRKRGAKSFAVTGPNPGTGKTSLTLALGVSFASARLRTLMIDCDLVGGALTMRVNGAVRRKIGRILQECGSIDKEQLDEAIGHATRQGRKLGEMLVKLKYVARAEVEEALAIQQQESMGLLDALGGAALADCVTGAGMDNLSILPLGLADARHVSVLSPDSLHDLLEEAKGRFDVVLIDTGPVPGSLEASLVASVADAVVVTVSRGEAKPTIERSIEHLASIHAHVAGIVFNHATAKDARAYGSSSLRATSVRMSSVKARDEAQPGGVGPLASAMRSHQAPASVYAKDGEGRDD